MPGVARVSTGTSGIGTGAAGLSGRPCGCAADRPTTQRVGETGRQPAEFQKDGFSGRDTPANVQGVYCGIHNKKGTSMTKLIAAQLIC